MYLLCKSDLKKHRAFLSIDLEKGTNISVFYGHLKVKNKIALLMHHTGFQFFVSVTNIRNKY